MSAQQIVVFTDGAAKGNPGPGGANHHHFMGTPPGFWERFATIAAPATSIYGAAGLPGLPRP
jgi:hypothetical protein